ncbi:MAG: hypothetical protein NXI01_08030, partial [Gammaproteobacteria bacterium]|nr:hypothetical protein [Gammaproteobacteria bacterium]
LQAVWNVADILSIALTYTPREWSIGILRGFMDEGINGKKYLACLSESIEYIDTKSMLPVPFIVDDITYRINLELINFIRDVRHTTNGNSLLETLNTLCQTVLGQLMVIDKEIIDIATKRVKAYEQYLEGQHRALELSDDGYIFYDTRDGQNLEIEEDLESEADLEYNDDEKSDSSTEKRLKKAFKRGSISVRNKNPTIQSTPIKIRSSFFKHRGDTVDEAQRSPFAVKLRIENEDHEDYAAFIQGLITEDAPSSDEGDLGLVSLAIEEDTSEIKERRDISSQAASDNESGDLGRKSSGEGFSSDSSLQRGTIDSQEFYIKTRVDYKTGSLSLSVSRLRPDTYLGRQQGAHITAYAVFVTAILESVDEQSIHEIPELLAAIAKKFIPEERWHVLDASIQAMRREAPEYFDKKNRKGITKDLRQKNVSESRVQIIKTALKVQQATFLAQLIDMISQEVLEGINQNRHRLYQRPKKKSKQDLGREGAKVRKTLQSLRAMQHLIKWKVSDKKETEVLVALKKGGIHQGLKVFLGKKKPSAQEINAFLQSVKRGSISEDKLEGISRTIGQLMFDLFDLDYYEYKASLILQEISNKTKRSGFEELLNAMDTADAVKIFERQEQEIENALERKNLKKVNDEIVENSERMVAQHFDILMRHAFSSLHYLPQEAKHSICSEFLRLMKKDMRWPEEIMEEISASIVSMVLCDEEEVTENLDSTMLLGGKK